MISLVQCIFIVKRRAKSIIELQKCKGQEKRDRLLISKMENNYQISQRNIFDRIDPILSNWVNFNKKVSIVNCSTNS